MAKKTTKPTKPGALGKEPSKSNNKTPAKSAAPTASPKDTKSGAMGKDPKETKLPETSKRGNWKHNGVWVDKEGYKVDNYGKRIKGQSKPFVPAKSNPFVAKQPAPSTPTEAAPTTPTGPAAPTPEQVADNVIVEGGGAYGSLVEDFENFDPYTMQQKYQQGFTEEMNRARDNMMQQFERRNSEQFARERESTQQSIVERGLDPNSPAAQAMQRDLNDRQDRARQEAYNAAEQQAYAVQQQFFGQAGQLAMMPYEQFATGIAPTFGIGLSAQYAQGEAGAQRDFQAKQADLQRQFDEAMRRGDRASAEKIAKMQQSNRGGGGNPNAANEAAYADYMNRLYGSQGQQKPQQTPGQAAGAGFGQGAIIGTVR
jgi:hypothetical protein